MMIYALHLRGAFLCLAFIRIPVTHSKQSLLLTYGMLPSLNNRLERCTGSDMFIFCHWYGIFEKGATKQRDSDYRKILKGALDMLEVSGEAEIKIGLEIF
ncbi:hypothetical protein [Klebsiella pneumoniae]|uniref:hypothetical protein n=1 Tax=Klebsiella pneumoniae TaxID=573 RepID=UPI00388EE7AC|nr:hypothetical protein [Klebsiella pneumoniae]